MWAAASRKNLVDGILEHCRQLRVLALLKGGNGGLGIPEFKVCRRNEHQLVICEIADYALDWRAGARGDFDMWMYAEWALTAEESVDGVGGAPDSNRIAWDSID